MKYVPFSRLVGNVSERGAIRHVIVLAAAPLFVIWLVRVALLSLHQSPLLFCLHLPPSPSSPLQLLIPLLLFYILLFLYQHSFYLVQISSFYSYVSILSVSFLLFLNILHFSSLPLFSSSFYFSFDISLSFNFLFLFP